jgi:WXG100 family type VII secretion target
MTSPWGLTPGELALARTDSGNTAASIADQVEALGRYVDELCAEWMGHASGSFGVLMGEYHLHAKSLEQTLDGIAATLGVNHDAVVDTEHTNIRLLTPHSDSGSKLSAPRF